MKKAPITQSKLLQQWAAYADGLLDARQLQQLVRQTKRLIGGPSV
jgi:hypothetical protein